MSLDAKAIMAMVGTILEEMGQYHVKEPDGSHRFRDLGMDSLELIEFLMLVQDKTGVEVTSDEVTFETSLAELAELIIRKAA